jgi:hypothetical protein
LVAGALEQLGVRYLLGGSLASTALGEPRATLDVDMVADLQPENVEPWLGALGEDFVGDREWIKSEVARRGSFQLIHQPSMIRIDVFVPEWTGVHLWKWENRRRLTLDPESGQGIDITGPEGIVIQKLIWFHESGDVSDRQWRDVLGVMKTHGSGLNLRDLNHWAGQLGIGDLLERALAEAAVDS